MEETLPLSSLIDFKRVSIPYGNKRNISFAVPHEAFSYYNNNGEKIQYKGKATITISNASPGIRSTELEAKIYKIEVEVK